MKLRSRSLSSAAVVEIQPAMRQLGEDRDSTEIRQRQRGAQPPALEARVERGEVLGGLGDGAAVEKPADVLEPYDPTARGPHGEHPVQIRPEVAPGLRIVGGGGADAHSRPGVACGSHLNFNAPDGMTLRGSNS